MDHRSLFGSIRNKISRSSTSASRRSTSSITPGNDSAQMPKNTNPYATTSPATRRPASLTTTRPSEPPPAYTPAPNAASLPPQNAPSSTSGPADDPYAFLSSFDTLFLIDDSGSMAGRSWRETSKALESITPICTAHDSDGIDIYFLNHPDNAWYHNVMLTSTVTEIFSAVRPYGGTPTGQRLNQILKPYLQRYEANPDGTKPLNIIVITDGEPSDDDESPIIAAAKKLDKLDAPAWQVGIQFFQVGREPGAKAHLKQLDDELAELAGDEDLRDIVDTVPFTGEEGTELTGDGILKVVLGAVNRRLDRKKSKHTT